MKNEYANKKVLIMGLGILGGGLATTKWFIKQGAKVTITDLKTEKELLPSLKALGRSIKKTKLVLGRHRLSDFQKNDVIVVNPAVPKESKFLKAAKKANKVVTNEALIFFNQVKNPIIAVTGTRGKTTTTNWIHYFLKQKFPQAAIGGNSSDNPLLKMIEYLDSKSPVVIELSSWQLEFLNQTKKAPQIAVITNLYPDHLDRYRSLKEYALAKVNIFKNQTSKNFLLLNKRNQWTKFFLKQKSKSKIVYFPKNLGVDKSAFREKYGQHNWENFSAAALAAHLAGVPKKIIQKAAFSLPNIKFRQEIILQNKKIKIINDTTATSPDAAIAAINRFAKEKTKLILIAGGTDKKLIFKEWAKTVKKYIKPENLFLLNGSAAQKMIKELKKISYFKNTKLQLSENLRDILKFIKVKGIGMNQFTPLDRAQNEAGRTSNEVNQRFIILFSPGAASFEKFKNEFDRGEKFNLLCKP